LDKKGKVLGVTLLSFRFNAERVFADGGQGVG
jgi:hypothetical protein